MFSGVASFKKPWFHFSTVVQKVTFKWTQPSNSMGLPINYRMFDMIWLGWDDEKFKYWWWSVGLIYMFVIKCLLDKLMMASKMLTHSLSVSNEKFICSLFFFFLMKFSSSSLPRFHMKNISYIDHLLTA